MITRCVSAGETSHCQFLRQSIVDFSINNDVSPSVASVAPGDLSVISATAYLCNPYVAHVIYFNTEQYALVLFYNINYSVHHFFFYSVFTTLHEFEPPHSRGFEITRKEAPKSV
jgi:hypothetical protein